MKGKTRTKVNKKLTFKQLEIGMLTKDDGLITHIGKAEDRDPIFKDQNFIAFFPMWSESYYGRAYRSVGKNSKFEILFKRGTSKYRAALERMLSECVDAQSDAQSNIELLHAWLKK